MMTAVATENRMTGLPLVANGQTEAAPGTPSTTLAKLNSGGAILSLAEKSGNPMAFLQEMGKAMAFSGMLGLKKQEQGATLLLICITENKTPLSVIQEYHLMDDGKMTKKADWVLSRFREIGGKYRIVNDGEDEVAATYEFSFAGNTLNVSYSMDDARKEGLIKDKSRWQKNPASMLRARVITKGVRMIAPEVMAGFQTAEELEGQDFVPVSMPPGTLKKRTTADVAAAKTATTATAPAESVVDVEFTPSAAKPAETEAAPFDGTTETATTAAPSSTDSLRTASIMEIQLLLEANGQTLADLVAAVSVKSPEVKSVDDLTDERIAGILANMRKKKEAADKAKIEAAGGAGAAGE